MWSVKFISVDIETYCLNKISQYKIFSIHTLTLLFDSIFANANKILSFFECLLCFINIPKNMSTGTYG